MGAHASSDEKGPEKLSHLLTVEEAAEQLRIHPSTVYRLARRGQLPAVKVGNQWRLDSANLEDWLRANSGAGAKPESKAS